jgi:hypothetical protein
MKGFVQIDSLLLHVGAGLLIAGTALYVGLAGALLVAAAVCVLLAEFVWVDQVKQFTLSLHRKNKGLTRKERRDARRLRKQLSTYVDDHAAAQAEAIDQMYSKG